MADIELPKKAPLTNNSVHMVRTTQQINVTLSQMADQKASMLMAATFVVFTLAVGQARQGSMLLPIVVLASFALVSAILSVMAVLPKVVVPTGPVADDDNILFFGIFSAISEQEFLDRVIARMGDDEAVYRTMLRDIYQNGRVLQTKKYRYLGYAYRTFLLGLGITFLLFIGEIATGQYL